MVIIGGKGLKDIAESAFGNLISNGNLCAVVKGEELLLLSSSRRGGLEESGEGNNSGVTTASVIAAMEK